MLLAFDLDSTLVTLDHRLPERIRKTIFAARDAGHYVTVLTGRTEASARQYLDLLEVSGPFGANHGARVFGPDGQVMRRAMLPGETVRDLIGRYQDRPGVEYSCSVDDKLFVRDPEDPRWTWAHTLNHELLPMSAYGGDPADKVVYIMDDGASTLHRELVAALPGHMYYLWGEKYLEVTAEEAHKGAALELIAKTLGYRREDTIAFGDGINDVTMLQWAGRGVAVGFAHPEAIAAADEHIPEPEKHGVADWLERELLSARVPSRS